uniref:Uncharacterized protein n=1 Tax=Acrobeloides nanus TaxID=290746 RepID=A0A914D9E3_9BILA
MSNLYEVIQNATQLMHTANPATEPINQQKDAYNQQSIALIGQSVHQSRQSTFPVLMYCNQPEDRPISIGSPS